MRALAYRRVVERKDPKLLSELDAELAIRPWESAEQADTWAKTFGATHSGLGSTAAIRVSNINMARKREGRSGGAHSV